MKPEAQGAISPPTVGVAVITHEARDHLRHCLPPLLRSPLRPRILVVNSSSSDGTVEAARRLGAEVLLVPLREFNHGLTREHARRFLGTGIVVMLSPDAYPTDEGFLERLTEPVRSGTAAVAYGRQLPQPGAGPLERLGREFSYPAHSQLRSLADWRPYGSYTHFCSNACAAWSNAALDRVGGFPADPSIGGDGGRGRLLRAGDRIAYVADANVVHSHQLTSAASSAGTSTSATPAAAYADLLRERSATRWRGRAFARGSGRHWREQPVRRPATRPSRRQVAGIPPACSARLPLRARRLSGQDYFLAHSRGGPGA